MPQHPADLTDDLVKMKHYQPAAIKAADSISQVELVRPCLSAWWARENLAESG